MLEEINSRGDLTLKSNHLSRDLLTKLSRFKRESKFCDIVLVVEDVEIPCHKLVLCLCSEYFEMMLTAGFSESSKECSRVEIKGTCSLLLNITHISYHILFLSLKNA